MAAIAITILLLAVTPASAAPEDPPAPVQTEESLLVQVWQWLASLFDPATAGTGGETSSGSCSVLAPGGRGCAIDPNGLY